MQQAVLLGIINNQQGLYVDSKAGVSLPIPEAMNRGLIKVEFSTTRKTQEKRSDVGLMTIKTQKESRHYSIVGVIDDNGELRRHTGYLDTEALRSAINSLR